MKMFLLIAILFCALIATLPEAAHAQGNYDYELLEPFLDRAGPGDGQFSQYMENVYKFALWTVGVAALLMLSIGGFMYMTSAGNNANAETAKRIIRDALLGLIVALLGWLLLFTINPDLVKINLNSITNLRAPSSDSQYSDDGSRGGLKTTQASTDGLTPEEIALINSLNAEDILIISSGDCFTQSNASCSSVTGLPSNAVDGAITLAQQCTECGTLYMTAGTEVGHDTHGPGEAIVDFRYGDPALTNYIKENSKGPVRDTGIGWEYTITEGSLAGATFLDETVGDRHWHVTYP